MFLAKFTQRMKDLFTELGNEEAWSPKVYPRKEMQALQEDDSQCEVFMLLQEEALATSRRIPGP
jgi:hypothetical protein